MATPEPTPDARQIAEQIAATWYDDADPSERTQRELATRIARALSQATATAEAERDSERTNQGSCSMTPRDDLRALADKLCAASVWWRNRTWGDQGLREKANEVVMLLDDAEAQLRASLPHRRRHRQPRRIADTRQG